MINVEEYQHLLDTSIAMFWAVLIGLVLIVAGILLAIAFDEVKIFLTSIVLGFLVILAGLIGGVTSHENLKEMVKDQGYYELNIDNYTFEGVRGEDGAAVLCAINPGTGNIDCAEK